MARRPRGALAGDIVQCEQPIRYVGARVEVCFTEGMTMFFQLFLFLSCHYTHPLSKTVFYQTFSVIANPNPHSVVTQR